MQKKQRRRVLRLTASVLLSAAALWSVSAAAAAQNAETAVRELTYPLALVRFEMGNLFSGDTLAPLSALALHGAPILPLCREAVAEAWSSELQQLPVPDTEEHEGTVLTAPPPPEITVTDNGVPSQTLRPGDPKGYNRIGDVYVNNGSDCALDDAMLEGAYRAVFDPGCAPQVLIVHTHGSEAYTMPPGEEYEASDDHRTTDRRYNMVRVGDEIADVLTAAGIGVVHDRELHDYPNYSGAYGRSLASIEAYLAEYPSIRFVLDVHRDAVSDASGRTVKLLSAENPDAAQMEFVIGTNGGGAKHDNWIDNLRLACAVEQTILNASPTLMRPITLRNSRYNQHATAGSLLLEVGTAGNSLEEALVSARLFAGGFADTLKGG